MHTTPAPRATHRIGARPTHWPQAALRGVARLIARAAEGLSRNAMDHRVTGMLARMSDRELKDIGLIRQDVFDAVSLPPGGDATGLLLERRCERRGARRP